MSDRIVVYGLLRRGESLAHLLDGASFEGRVVLEGFELVDLGPYPAAVPGQGRLVCEVYAGVDVTALDVIEGVHTEPALYRRERVETPGGPAWIYLYARPVDGFPRIDSGDWLGR